MTDKFSQLYDSDDNNPISLNSKKFIKPSLQSSNSTHNPILKTNVNSSPNNPRNQIKEYLKNNFKERNNGKTIETVNDGEVKKSEIKIIDNIESLIAKQTILIEKITNNLNNLNSLNNLKNTSKLYPAIEKSFRSLDGQYLINISSSEFFVLNPHSRENEIFNQRLWLTRITNLTTYKSYSGECYEYFWKPFVGLFLIGIQIKQYNKKIIIKFNGGDEIDFDETNDSTLVEVKDYESTLFIE